VPAAAATAQWLPVTPSEGVMGERRNCRCAGPSQPRRTVLKGIAGLSLGAAKLARGDASAALAPPQQGDGLVFAFGDRAGMPIAPDDLAVGAQQVFAYPQDTATGQVRDGSRLNQLLVVRLDVATLAPETLARAADGVVAYSGVCSHTGCDVTDWYAASARFKCPCHESEFDPSDGARVVGGPAPWQLAALPLRVVDGRIAVAGPFEGRVGFLQPGQDPFGL
jgi:rieske iron-sulfur protein